MAFNSPSLRTPNYPCYFIKTGTGNVFYPDKEAAVSSAQIIVNWSRKSKTVFYASSREHSSISEVVRP